MKENINSDRKNCTQPVVPVRVFNDGVSPNRAGFILASDKKWANGTLLTFAFLEGNEGDKDVVRKAFKTWKDLGINLAFKEVTPSSDPTIRIGFDVRDGSWSYVGRDVLTISKNERTMNFGWRLTGDSYGMTTAIHEIGHTLGLQHEHQNPNAGILWNTPKVISYFSGPPNNWDRPTIDHNILNKLAPNSIQASNWDPDSIMHYSFDKGLIQAPEKYQSGVFPPGTLSPRDIDNIRKAYPPVIVAKVVRLSPNKSAVIKAASGDQNDFYFTAPLTRKYNFQTYGELDTVMVIFEKGPKQEYYLSGDDDSGVEKNSKIRLPCVKGRRYRINVRVLYSPGPDAGGIIVA